jgi:CHRD domain-containing protein
MRVSRTCTVATTIALASIACSDDVSGIPAGLEVFTATLTGANERPPVTTSATGTAILTVLGDLVTWKVDVANIDNVNAAYLYIGGPEETGNSARNLNPVSTGADFTGTVANGTAPIADSVVALMRAGGTYVNVHTQANGGGEIRGQLVKQ